MSPLPRKNRGGAVLDDEDMEGEAVVVGGRSRGIGCVDGVELIVIGLGDGGDEVGFGSRIGRDIAVLDGSGCFKFP